MTNIKWHRYKHKVKEANLYCIRLSEHETYAYADAVQIWGNICNAQYVLKTKTNTSIIVGL